MIPKMGAFEVSTVAGGQSHGQDILFFSKVIAKMWPHIGDLAKKIVKFNEEWNQEVASKQNRFLIP